MPQSPESGCAANYFGFGARPGLPRAVGGPETGRRPARRGLKAALRGYRGRPHPGGTLGCGVGAPPARGEAGPSVTAPRQGGPGWPEEEQRTMAPPHRGPGV
jgi:hypothetical protein